MPTFRGSVNAVTVDVSIRDKSRRAITGLTAKDFQVFDNGVLQTVDNVSFGRLPIDVTVALDISYSVTGTLLERLRRGVVDLMDDLRKEDRLKLVLFNMRVNRTVDFTADVREVERALKGVTAGGGTALLDAISVALVAARQPDRRQLIVVFTDGTDSSSSTTPDMLTRVAERTPGTLTFVMPTVAPAITITQGTSVTRIGGVRALPPLAPLFRTLARETGGDVLDTGASGDLSATFRRAINDFRSAYVLYYSVRGVERGGYHTIEVKVAREGATVQARRGLLAVTRLRPPAATIERATTTSTAVTTGNGTPMAPLWFAIRCTSTIRQTSPPLCRCSHVITIDSATTLAKKSGIESWLCVRLLMKKVGPCQRPQISPSTTAAPSGLRMRRMRGSAKPRQPSSSPTGPGSVTSVTRMQQEHTFPRRQGGDESGMDERGGADREEREADEHGDVPRHVRRPWHQASQQAREAPRRPSSRAVMISAATLGPYAARKYSG